MKTYVQLPQLWRIDDASNVSMVAVAVVLTCVTALAK